MSIVADVEYKILVTHLPVNEPSIRRWRALLLGFPDIVAEADSREQVVTQIEARLRDVLRNSEIMTLTAPSRLPSVTTGDEEALRAQGWDDHGLFRDDPDALRMFDEIEEERSRHTVGGE